MPKITIRIHDDLVRQVSARDANVSESIREALSRYYYMLGIARSEIRDTFTTDELSLLCDICNGTIFEPHSLNALGQSVLDAEDDYFERWSVDRRKLYSSVGRLDLLQDAALVDAIERYWQASGTGMSIDVAKLLY